jgi:hypothetical protein
MTDFGDDPSERAVSLLRNAARELLPVVVDMGPDQAKYSSFISSVSDHGHPHVVLEPIAADALPSGERALRIVPAAGRHDWTISATSLWRANGARVCVDLAGARVLPVDEAEASVAVQATDLLVLVVPGGLNNAAYVFPVLRIGAELCEIRCSVPLSVGQDLECVELVGDRRLLRRAAAQVLEVVPWYTADGSQSFSCRLSLSEEAVDAGRSYDLVTDAGDVRRLLESAAAMRVHGWFEVPGHDRGSVHVVEVGKDYAQLELGAPNRRNGHDPVTDARSLRIGMDLFAVTYELDVRVLDRQDRRLRTSLPLILRRRRRHRRDQRVAVDPALGLEFAFRNPVSGTLQSARLTELSFFGLAFEFDARAAVIWRGLPLEQARIGWGAHAVELGDLRVEHSAIDRDGEQARCVASIGTTSITDDPEMIALMATLTHPQVRAHDGGDFSALHQTYLKAGLFGPHMHRNLDPIVEQAKRVWHLAHHAAADVVRTFVHGPEEAPDAAVTVMRAWEYAWVAQHFVDTSPELASGTGKLQTAYLEHLVPRPDGRYLLFFVKTDNRIMNAYLRRFFATTGTPDAVTRCVVELWSRKPGSSAQPQPPCAEVSMRSCEAADELLVARAAQRCFGVNAAAALSMLPGSLLLPDTSRRFRRAGLERDRSCDLVLRGGTPVYAILEERSTPGLNLTWMLNACWIIPIRPELDADCAALDRALCSAVERPAQTTTGERFLNLPEGIDAQTLQRWGFAKEAAVYLYVLTRAGLHRFFHYATTRYGELDALAARRERRRIKPEAGV